jgi:hypothetical protein
MKPLALVVVNGRPRAPLGEHPVIQESVDRGTRYSILPAITVDGYIAVRVVEGSVDSAEFFDFVLFGNGIWIASAPGGEDDGYIRSEAMEYGSESLDMVAEGLIGAYNSVVEGSGQFTNFVNFFNFFNCFLF